MPFSKLKTYTIDIVLEIIGVVIILGCFLFVALTYESLPDLLPRHYGSDGDPDAYGEKTIVWVLPIFGLFLFFAIGLTYQAAQIGLGALTQLPEYFKLVSLGLLLGIPLVYILPDMVRARRLE